MMSFIISMLAGRFGPVIIGATGAALAIATATAAIQGARVERLKDDVRDAKAALYVPGAKPRQTWEARARSLETRLGQCDAALEAQNAAVRALETESARRATEVAQALQAARNQAATLKSAADRILDARLPADDTCKRLLEVERLITENSR